MARIFITGSADGLGKLTANSLLEKGHQVVLHARNEQRGQEAMEGIPGAVAVVTGDLGNLEETIQLASKVNDLGRFDTIIHNAGVFRAPGEEIFRINTLAPYVLTALIEKPQRLIYLSSSLHLGGSPKFENFKTRLEEITYSDSKLHVLMLCKAVARKYSNIYANAVNPGWVPTKMGGKGAPDDLTKGYETQVQLAESNDERATVSGRYFYHQKENRYHPEADNEVLQDQFLNLCREITGVSFS